MALTRLRKEIDAAVQLPVFDLSREELVQEALENHEGVLAANGALRAVTGKHTGRSPKDKFFVDDELTHDKLCWDNNQACSKETFDRLLQKMLNYAATHKMYVSPAGALC